MQDAFEQLGLAPRFDLDEAELERAWLQRSAALHPDLGADPEAADALAALNEAKVALSDPERRANLLLARLRGPSKEDDRTLPPEFLTAMMEVQEAIDEEGADLDEWRSWAESKRREIIDDVRTLFDALPDPPRPQNLTLIRTRLNEWRYIERIAERLRD